MDFSLSTEQKMLVETVSRFVAQELQPLEQAVEDAGVESGGIAVVQPDVGVRRAAERDAPEEVEVIALVETPSLLDDEEGVRALRLAALHLVVAGLESRRGGAAQVAQRHPRDPEQKQVEDGEEAELERYS